MKRTPSAREPVQVRGLDVRSAVRREVGPAEVVPEDEQDVGAACVLAAGGAEGPLPRVLGGRPGSGGRGYGGLYPDGGGGRAHGGGEGASAQRRAGAVVRTCMRVTRGHGVSRAGLGRRWGRAGARGRARWTPPERVRARTYPDRAGQGGRREEKRARGPEFRRNHCSPEAEALPRGGSPVPGRVPCGARGAAGSGAATDGARDTSQIDVAALHERDRVITEGLHGEGACPTGHEPVNGGLVLRTAVSYGPGRARAGCSGPAGPEVHRPPPNGSQSPVRGRAV